jgi:hypothetical protein
MHNDEFVFFFHTASTEIAGDITVIHLRLACLVFPEHGTGYILGRWRNGLYIPPKAACIMACLALHSVAIDYIFIFL